MLGAMSGATSLSGRAISILRRRFLVLAGAAFWPYLALVLLFAVLRLILQGLIQPGPPTDPVQLWQSSSVLAKFGVIAAFIASASLPWGLSAAGVSLIVCEHERGRAISLRDVIARLLRRVPALLVLSYLLGIGLFFLSAFFIVPGLMIWAVGYPALAAMIDDGAGIGRALRRGSEVALSRLGTMLRLVILFGIIGLFLALSLRAVLPALAEMGDLAVPFGIWGFMAIVPPVLIMIVGTLMAILFCDVRREREQSLANSVPVTGGLP